MASLQEIMQVCRLCLVSDQVNVPIFDGTSDIRETFAKISSCLPVKVSKDDNLPKKICEGCSYKLDLLYDFRNTSVSSEKQLLQWLQQIGVSSGIPTTAVSSGPNATTQTNSDILVKQESFEHNEGAAAATAGGMSAEAQSYIMQQQKLPYRQEFPGFGESSTSTSEPPPKRARRAAAMKAPIAPETDSDEDDLDNDMTITKAESDDDSDEPDQPSYVDATSTSVDDQPGPSGVGKPSVEAIKLKQELESDWLHRYNSYLFAYNDEDSVNGEIKSHGNEFLDGSFEGDEERQTKSQGSSKIRDSDLEYIPESESNDSTEEKKQSPPGKLKVKKIKVKKERKRNRTSHCPKKSAKGWSCKKCFRVFTTCKDLKQHSKTHAMEEKEKALAWIFNLEQNNYVCTTCLSDFPEEQDVIGHIKETHTDQFTCLECHTKFSTAYAFASHMVQHREDRVFQCPLCDFGTTRSTGLISHLNTIHYRKYYHYCQTCGKGFNDSTLFKEHDNEHLGIKPFICVVCGKDFVYSRYLLIHQTRFHTVGIDGQKHSRQCHICFKMFTKVSTRDKHMLSSHIMTVGAQKQLHLCDVCGKGYSGTDKLKLHYRIHTGEKPFVCTYCGKSFTKRDYLTLHVRTHTGERPYACEYCGKTFNQPAPLKIHVRGHTGERPYTCEFCNAGYISKASLNIHKKVCLGLFVPYNSQ